MFCFSEYGLSAQLPLFVLGLSSSCLIFSQFYVISLASAASSLLICVSAYAAIAILFLLSRDLTLSYLSISLFVAVAVVCVPMYFVNSTGLSALPSLITAYALLVSHTSQHPFSILLSIELVSLSSLLILTEVRSEVTKVFVMSYYWISALCALGLTSCVSFLLLNASTLSRGVFFESSFFLSLFVFSLLAANVGSLPSGFWAIWFYDLIPQRSLFVYLSFVYPSLMFVTAMLLSFVNSVVGVQPLSILLFSLMSMITSLLTTVVNQSTSSSLPSLLVSLTSVTFVLLLGVSFSA